ncbi:MAG: glycosyltransferase family 2 protein [Bacteroidales bacterium]|nr:glycosyltransferase family 2 protein [Bacteroidales bacterium]
MLHNLTIAVVIPAYNEADQIDKVLESMPGFVDRIVVVNDRSTDQTEEVVLARMEKDQIGSRNEQIGPQPIKRTLYNEAEMVLQERDEEEIKDFVPSELVNSDPENDRIILINNLKNGGVGAAIARGYKWCKDNNIDCTAVMAGDGQMDPAELEGICLPVVNGSVAFVKGNRLIHRSAKLVIPRTRYLGNSILSIMTKMASGYWKISDTQTGYTAISLQALKKIDLPRIYRRYGMPNDLLVKLNIARCSICEVEIKPVYRIGENSKMKVMRVIPRITWMLFKAFFKRIWIRYFKRDFHPLFLLYMLGIVLFLASVPFLVEILRNLFVAGSVTSNSILLIYIFLVTSSLQSLFFAMWMDIQDNDRLQL